VVDQGVIYISSINGADEVGDRAGYLYAIDGASGHPRWRVDTGDGVSSQPAVARGIVYVGRMVDAIEGRFSAARRCKRARALAL
jgi:outer membrane protein assembly factor BamB